LRCGSRIFETIVAPEDGAVDHHRRDPWHALLVGVLGCPPQLVLDLLVRDGRYQRVAVQVDRSGELAQP
jgi:hypothetical protein